jgi:PAS domain S-box-containing protein
MAQPPSEESRVARLQTLLNATEQIILLVDASGVIVEGNEAAARVFETQPGALAGKSIYDITPVHSAFIDKTRIEEVGLARQPTQFETVLNGTFFAVRLYPVLDDKGTTREIAVYAHDVAERKLMEAALRQTEEMYRKIYENATEGIFQITVEGRFLSANPALARTHGFDSPEELIASVTDISRQLHADPERRKELIHLLGRYGHVENFEARSLRKDGSIGWISINARLVRDIEGKPLYHEGTMQEITTRKEAEEALRESEERYRTAVENSNDGIAILREGRHEYVNRRFVEMFEYSEPEEIIGLPVTFNVHPDDLERVASITDLRRRGEPAPLCYEFKGITKTGAIIHIEVSATTMTYRGKPVSFVYLRDITERKRSEESLIESRNELERLNRAKSKAMDHISHEIRTPVALVQATVRILRRKLEETPEKEGTERFLDMLQRNVDRLFEISDEASEILRASKDLEAGGLMDDIDRLEQRMESLSEVPEEMRVCAREIKEWVGHHMSGSRGRFRIIEIRPFAESVVEKVRYFARTRQVRIVVEGGEPPLYISMNPGILREVLEALLKNAVENTPDGGLIRVHLEEESGRAWIHVIDTGVGITAENQPYIFDGLFHATDTDLYSSKKSYDFGAGGKGLDLLKLKVYAKRFGFEITMSSTRCGYIPTERDLCPGNIASCPHVRTPEECAASGGSTFSVAFRASSGKAEG